MTAPSHPPNHQPGMSRFLMVNAVAERAKTLQQGSRPLLDMGGKLKRPLDIAIEEIRHGLIKVESSSPSEEAPKAAGETHAGGNGADLAAVLPEPEPLV